MSIIIYSCPWILAQFSEIVLLSLFSTENSEKLLWYILDNQITVYAPWFSRTSLNHHWIWLLSVCQVPSFWLCSIFSASTVRGRHSAALEMLDQPLRREYPGNSRILPPVLLEMGRRLGRIQNLLGCLQSCVEFMAVKLFMVGDPAQSNQTELEQLWANFLRTTGKLSKTLTKENPMLKNHSKTLHMHTSTP